MITLSNLKNAVDCGRCSHREVCGGLEESQITMTGCFAGCLGACQSSLCDLTCPNNQPLYSARLAEIGGSFGYERVKLRAAQLKPSLYVPAIPNASGRTVAVRKRVVALPLRAVVRVANKRLHCAFRSGEELADHLKISRRAAVIICCVTHDDEIERMWDGLRYGHIASELSKLRPAAIIVPNFSFFTDVPRTHTLYNRKRISVASSILSESGCPVIPHISALTQNDWAYWRHLLADNPAIKYVAKEFQTGLSNPKLGSQAIENLARLQDSLGRQLHPIAIGGGKYAGTFSKRFESYTIMDSRPFIRTVRRRLLTLKPTGGYDEVYTPTELGAPVDGLFLDNLRAHENRLIDQVNLASMN